MKQQIPNKSHYSNSNITSKQPTIRQKIESQFFEFFLFILNTQSKNQIINTLCVFTELCQMMTYPLHPRFAPIWKYNSFFLPLSTYFQYFLLVPILHHSSTIYLILFYFVFLCLVGMSILYIYSSFLIKQQTLNHLWPLKIMSIILSLFGNVIFLPLFETMLSIFYCDNKKINIYSTNLQCWTGVFYVHMTFAIIGIIIILALYLPYVFICYDVRKLSMANNTKKTSLPDFVLIVVKAYLSIVNASFKGVGFHVFVLFISFLLSLYLLYLFWAIRPYHSIILTKLYCISTFILCWGYALILIGCIFLQSKFNGGLALLFIGIIGIILAISFTGTRVNYEIVFFHVVNSTSGEIVKDKLLELEELCDNESKERQNEIILRSYIQKHEETCIIAKCNLQQYLKSSNKIYLYLHLEYLYQLAISTHPHCLSLRFRFIILLFDKLNKIRKAKYELEKIYAAFNLRLDNQFALFQLNNQIEIRLSNYSNRHHHTYLYQPNENINMSSNTDLSVIRFKLSLASFKTSIIKTASLYLEFWNLLLIFRNDISEDLTKLNNLGSKINNQIEEVNQKLDNLQKIKKNDDQVMQLYTEFLNNILNKKDQAVEYRRLLLINDRRETNEGNENDNDNDDDANSNFGDEEILEEDFCSMTAMKNKMYIIISAQKETFCIITHISLGICSQLGYSRSELIGRSLDLILPELFIKQHKALLMNKIAISEITPMYNEKYDNKSNNTTTTTPLSPNKVIKTYAMTKSRYILPMSFNVFLSQNENEKKYFIAKITSDYLQQSNQSINFNYPTIEESISFVLTDKYLRIKNFTSNAVRLLGLDSNEMNGSFELTSYIKEFNEEFMHKVIESNDREKDDYYTTQKANMAREYFKLPCKITWKHTVSISPSSPRRQRLKKNDALCSLKKVTLDLNQSPEYPVTFFPSRCVSIKKEKNFMVNLIEQKINSHVVGFIFKFENCKALLSQESFNLVTTTGSNNAIPKLVKKISLNQFGFINEKKASLIDSNHSVGVSFADKQQIDQLKIINQYQQYYHNQNVNQNQSIAFDKTFIPSAAPAFILDSIHNVYKLYQQPNNVIDNDTDTGSQIRQKLKQKALDILRIPTKGAGKANFANLSSTSMSLSDSKNEYYSNKESDKTGSSMDSIESIKSNKNHNNNQIINAENKFDYYHIDLNRIKLMVYDYRKKMPIDYVQDLNYKHKGELELKLEESTREELPRDLKQMSQLTKSIINKKKSILSSTALPEAAITKKPTPSTMSTTKIREFLIKQIDYSLKRKDTQITIILFQLISLATLIILLLEAGVLLYISLYSQKSLKELTTLLIVSGELVLASVMSIYHVRELTLLNNENYTVPSLNREEYLANHTMEVFLLFEKYSAMLNYVSTSKISLHDDSYLALFNKTITNKIITSTYHGGNITVSIYTSFVLNQLSLFKISQTDNSLLLPSNKDAYFFIYNSMNRHMFNEGEQIAVFTNKILSLFRSQKKTLLAYSIVIAITHFALYLGLRIVYFKVVNKKTSYLEVFLKINSIIIAQLYEKCNKFLNKIQVKDKDNINKFNCNVRVEGGDEYSDSFKDEYDDDIDLLNSFSFKESRNKAGVSFETSQSKTSNKQNMNSSNKEARCINWIFIFLFVCLFGVLFGMVVYYWSFFYKMDMLIIMYTLQLNIQVNYLMAFNIIREYIVDTDSEVYMEPITDYTLYMVAGYTTEISRMEKEFEANIEHLSPQFQTSYYNINYNNVCRFATDYFIKNDSNSSCEEISNNATSYGLKQVLMMYFEEIRFLKGLNDRNFKNFHNVNFKFNFTLLNTPIGDSYWPSRVFMQILYWGLMPVHIFNSKSYLTVSFLFRYIIRPSLAFILRNMYLAIQYEAVRMEQTLAIVLGCFMGLFLLFYVFVWKPFESRLNSSIYKTKNMLAIIPNEVLIQIKNIDVLLELDRNALINEPNE